MALLNNTIIPSVSEMLHALIFINWTTWKTQTPPSWALSLSQNPCCFKTVLKIWNARGGVTHLHYINLKSL